MAKREISERELDHHEMMVLETTRIMEEAETERFRFALEYRKALFQIFFDFLKGHDEIVAIFLMVVSVCFAIMAVFCGGAFCVWLLR